MSCRIQEMNTANTDRPHYIMLQRFLPQGPTKSTMQYQIFRNKKSTEDQFQLIAQMYKRIVGEDKVLCELAQKNLNRGVFVNGELHPRLEKGPLYFQKVARETIWHHVKQERAAKKEIWPTRQAVPEEASFSREDEELCSGLACAPAKQTALVW